MRPCTSLQLADEADHPPLGDGMRAGAVEPPEEAPREPARRHRDLLERLSPGVRDLEDRLARVEQLARRSSNPEQAGATRHQGAPVHEVSVEAPALERPGLAVEQV